MLGKVIWRGEPARSSPVSELSTAGQEADVMGEWTILERLLEAAVQQHSTMIGR